MTDTTSDYPNTLSIASLQTQIRGDEAVRLKLTAIEAMDTGSRRFTLGSFDRVPITSPRVTKIRLVRDPTGNTQPNADEALVCRGTAWLDGRQPAEQVAAFRKKTAVAAPPAPQSPAPPAPDGGSDPDTAGDADEN